MASAHLIGNHHSCPGCLRVGRLPSNCRCLRCFGTRRVLRPEAEIVRRTVEEARRVYWPAVEARWAAGR